MRIAYATFDFVIVNIAASFVTPKPDVLTWLWYALSVLLAFSLRLGIEYDNNKLTRKNLVRQTIYTISWVFLSVLFYKEMKWQGWFEIYLFLNSLFGVFFVSHFEVTFKQVVRKGFKTWLRGKLNWLLADEKGGKS